MDQSPPKRVTRARAAAKDTAAPELKTARIATAASKAKVTRSVSTTKRKTRSDDNHQDEQQPEPEEIIEPKPRASARGRAKKAVEPEAEMNEPPVRATRGKRAAIETPAPEPVRTTRGRAKKADVSEEEAIVIEQPVKRAPRTRAATVTRAAPKKSVKFEEPDKENIIPVEIGKGKAKVAEPATGLRAKPVRKPAVPARTTRGRAKSITEEDKAEKSSPLSPKKATQMGRAKELASDDELATNEKTPMKPLMKSPIKPPGSVFGTAKKLDFSTTITAHNAIISSTQDLKASITASPARRPPQSPFKESLKVSPQRPGMGNSLLQSPFKPSLPAPKSVAPNSPLKASLLQSPARRPQSPTKVTETGSPTRSTNGVSTFAVTPKVSTFKISRFATPRTVTKSGVKMGQMLPPSSVKEAPAASPSVPAQTTNEALSIEPSLTFSGRLSSIMPREADPAFRDNAAQQSTMETDDVFTTGQIDERMSVDEPEVEEEVDTIVVDDRQDEETSTPPCSPPRHSTGFAGAFGLRETDESPFHDSDSEDELASTSARYSPAPLTGFRTSSHDFASSPATPTPFSVVSKTPQTATQRAERREKIGFTPLARQLSDWMAASPAKSESIASDDNQGSFSTNTFAEAIEADMASVAQPSPAKSTFFEDEMSVRDELAADPEPSCMEPDLLTENFEPVELDEEDMALAHEADEMSLLEPDEIDAPAPEEMFTASEPTAEIEVLDDVHQVDILEATPSEASQEYGDENAMPIDPSLLAASEIVQAPTPRAFATPKRVLSERVCHTVSKVPLKPAADHTPMRPSPLKRSASISRLPTQRPTTTLTRKNTVISYSPTKSTPRAQAPEQNQDTVMQETFATPSKANGAAWSTLGTPARTPRRDINNELLKGAVVFVDVHTSEGADASALFTELLTQMGARCVKSWNWNGEDGSKVGITHLVFKDGGKRALEKAKGTNGVVSCVGVGWVLEYVYVFSCSIIY